MHEVSIARALLTAVERVERGPGTRIAALHLRLGRLTCVDPDSLAFAFEIVSRGTPAAGALLVFDRVPVTGRCRRCDYAGEAGEELGCPVCGAVGLEVITGRELELVALEVEDS